MRILTLILVLAVAISAAAQTEIPVRSFQSIELQNGGHVIVRHGNTQRVRVVRGNLRNSRIRVEEDDHLVIDIGPDHDRVQIEVTTPALTAFTVSNGGTLRCIGDFPGRDAIVAHVEQGGTVDIRSIPADAVDASVFQGGRILTSVRDRLTARVDNGGNITYWGEPRVKKSIRRGGVVVQGD